MSKNLLNIMIIVANDQYAMQVYNPNTPAIGANNGPHNALVIPPIVNNVKEKTLIDYAIDAYKKCEPFIYKGIKFVQNGDARLSMNLSKNKNIQNTNIQDDSNFNMSFNFFRYFKIDLALKYNEQLELKKMLKEIIFADFFIGSNTNKIAFGNYRPRSNITNHGFQYNGVKNLITLPFNKNNNNSSSRSYFINENNVANLPYVGNFVKDYLFKQKTLWAGFSICGVSLVVCNNKDISASYTYLSKKKSLLLEIGATGIYDNDNINYKMLEDIYVIGQLYSSIIGSIIFDKKNTKIAIILGLCIFGFLHNVHYSNKFLSIISFFINPNIIFKINNSFETIAYIEIFILKILILSIIYDFQSKNFIITLALNIQNGIISPNVTHKVNANDLKTWYDNDFKLPQQTAPQTTQ